MLFLQRNFQSFQRNSKIFQRYFSRKEHYDLFNPTEQHLQLRHLVKSFCDAEVKTQSSLFDKEEIFNVELFRKLGDLGLLGITVAEEYGGSGLFH